MRHHIVTRIVVALVVLWAAAVVIFAWGVTRPVPTPATAPAAAGAGPSGEALFSRHCAMCHQPADVGQAWRDAADREAAGAAFREFLTDHYGPSPEGNAAIVDYVMEREPR
jgi:mono/diheme cytochrome c family protein